MKSEPAFQNSSDTIKSSINGHTETLIHPKNLLFNNINTVFQQQLHRQQLIQQQLFELQLNQENKKAVNNYQPVSPANSPESEEIQQEMSRVNYLNNQSLNQQNLIQNSFAQSPLSTSNSSTMELPIINQNLNYCSSVSTSSENSLMISPVSTPTSGSPINFSSPVTSSTSSPLPAQSINQSFATFMPNIEQYQRINQLLYQEMKSNKINKNQIDQNDLSVVNLVDSQTQKKGKRKTNTKIKPSNKSDFKMEINPSKVNDKVKQKAKQRNAANERERKRMSNINQAFSKLRIKLNQHELRLSKIDILRFAARYIIELREQLEH